MSERDKRQNDKLQLNSQSQTHMYNIMLVVSTHTLINQLNRQSDTTNAIFKGLQ